MTSLQSTDSTKTLSEKALAILRTRGENISVKEGFRTLSSGAYSPPGSLAEEDSFEVPDELESVPTLLFLELEPATAAKVWKNYSLWVKDFPHRASILEAAINWVNDVEGADAATNDEEWEEAFEIIGVTKAFQERVLDPRWTHMRVLSTPKELTVEMFHLRFEFLEQLDAFVIETSAAIERETTSTSNEVKHFIIAPELIPPRASSHMSDSSWQASTPIMQTPTEPPPAPLEHHTTLYKGSSVARLNRINGREGLNFARISSTPPGDFSSTFRGVYFTKNYFVACEYAKWACQLAHRRRLPMAILKVAVPNSILRSIKDVAGDDWRTFVWLNGRDEVLPHYFDNLMDFQWLTGPICGMSSFNISRLSNKNGLTTMRLPCCHNPTQHFANQKTTINLLNAHCQNTVVITPLADRNTK